MDSTPVSLPTRRAFLAGAAGTAIIGLCPYKALASDIGAIRRINLYNPRTEEWLNTIYYKNGRYIPEELAKVDRILRDVRAKKMTLMDARLIDIVAATQYVLGVDRPAETMSGYRTPATNAALSRTHRGVAKHSYHMRGMAMDLRIEGVPASAIERVGLGLGAGGVGLYSRSNFVHLDSGPVRRWGS